MSPIVVGAHFFDWRRGAPAQLRPVRNGTAVTSRIDDASREDYESEPINPILDPSSPVRYLVNGFLIVDSEIGRVIDKTRGLTLSREMCFFDHLGNLLWHLPFPGRINCLRSLFFPDQENKHDDSVQDGIIVLSVDNTR